MSLIAFDIETIPNNRAEEYFTTIKRYKAPSNYKDQEKIQSYIQESIYEDIQRAGLYWWSGKVICISLEKVLSGKKITLYEEDEVKLLTQFAKALKDNPGFKIIGKSSKDFDIPFLKGRYLHHDIGFPESLHNPSITDVDEIFSYSRSCGQVSNLNTYAFGMGLETKTSHGSKVHQMYLEGNVDEIKEYCAHDTHIVAEMLRRYLKVLDV